MDIIFFISHTKAKIVTKQYFHWFSRLATNLNFFELAFDVLIENSVQCLS
jgi:hypothetical protein